VPRENGFYGHNTRVQGPWQQDQGTCDGSRVEAWVMETLEQGRKEFSEVATQRQGKLELQRVIECRDSPKVGFIIAETFKLLSCFAFFLIIFGLL
jgi:hypothetical protein